MFEYTQALNLDPGSGKTLKLRARALEMAGSLAEARNDYQMLQTLPGGRTPEIEKKIAALEAEMVTRRKHAAAAANGVHAHGAHTTKRNAANANSNANAPRPPPPMVELKLVMGAETRVWRGSSNEATYASLLEAARLKFSVGDGSHVKLVYTDVAGDRVTVTTRADLVRAQEAAAAAASSTSITPSHTSTTTTATTPGGAQVTRLEVVPVASASEVPPVPEEEANMVEQTKQMRKYVAEMQERHTKQQLEALEAQHAQQHAGAGAELVEVDSWIVQFAQLFRDHLNIDPDRHVDLAAEGWEKVTAALDRSVTSDQAVPLFESGIAKFQEVIALGQLNWGHAHAALARKHMEDLARKGLTLAAAKNDALYGESVKAFTLAGEKMELAYASKPDFYDVAMGLGQLWFDRAKLAAGLLMANPATSPDAVSSEEEKKKKDDAVYKACLARLEAKSVEEALPLFEKAADWHHQGVGLARLAVGGNEAQAQASAQQLRNQSHILAGNVFYEVSQIRAATKADDWRSWVERAVARFNEASCDEADILQALRNHSRAGELSGMVADYEAKVKAKEEEKQKEKEKEKEGKAKKGGPSLPKRK